ncbi:amidohydrolase [Candidatus Poribacteria bacterium]|nr:amidohydrolase [Candidatus Poribacteria bacterium]
MSRLIIDFHNHLGKGDPDAGPLQRDLYPDMLIRVMDEGGVWKSVVFPVKYRDFKAACDEIKGYVDRYPGRLIGFGRVGDTPDAPDIVEYCIDELGFKGLKIHHGLENIDPDSPNLKKVLDIAEERQFPIIFDAFSQNAEKVFKVAEAGYTFPIVMAHMGGLWNVTWMDRCIEHAERYQNVYLETSSVLLFAKIEEAVKRIGADRIIFGTDGPGIHPAPEIRKIEILHIPEADKDKILGLNAKRLLGI